MKERRFFSALSFRLMLFNGLLVFLPLAALLVFDVFESNMLKAQETTMATNAKLIAVSLRTRWNDWKQLDAEQVREKIKTEATSLFLALEKQNPSRLRVLDRNANVLADSSVSPQPVPPARSASNVREAPSQIETPDAFSSLIYAVGSIPFRVVRALGPPAPAEDDETGKLSENPAVRQALGGEYGSWTRVSKGQRSVTLYSAVSLVPDAAENPAVVLVSQSTWRTLRSLYEIRKSLFQIFLVAIAASVALSFLLSLTIVRPLKRMRQMAEGFIDQWGRPTGSFVPVRGSNELASLSKALVRLGDGLSEHVRFIESFASDLSHELRNPLSSIQTAAELLNGANSNELERLSALIQKETRRIDKIVSVSKDLSRLDVQLARSERSRVDVVEVVSKLIQSWSLKSVHFEPSAVNLSERQNAAFVLADADFLMQAIDKLIENAVSFSPQDCSVRLEVEVVDQTVCVHVSDRGPGIDETKFESIFQRFYSERREQGHTGLGLSLAQTIVGAYGGRIRVRNRDGGGAELTVELPKSN